MTRQLVGLTMVLMLLAATTRSEQLKTLSITSADVISAETVTNSPTLKLVLTPSKTKELAELTRSSLNKKIAITVCGELVSEPLVKAVITGKDLELQAKDEETAFRLARSLMKKDKNAEPAH